MDLTHFMWHFYNGVFFSFHTIFSTWVLASHLSYMWHFEVVVASSLPHIRHELRQAHFCCWPKCVELSILTNWNDWIIVFLSFFFRENIPATIMLWLSFATKTIFFCLYICHRKHKRIFHIVCGIYLLRLSHKLYFAHWTQYRQKIIVYWVRTYMSMTNFSVLSVALFTMFEHLSLLKNEKKIVLNILFAVWILTQIANEFPMHSFSAKFRLTCKFLNTAHTMNRSVYGKSHRTNT